MRNITPMQIFMQSHTILIKLEARNLQKIIGVSITNMKESAYKTPRLSQSLGTVPSSETHHSCKTCFKQYSIPDDTYALCLCEIFAINYAKRRRKYPGLEMLKNVMGSDFETDTKIAKTGNY